MALSQTDLDALDTAIASAELEVEIEGRRVKYRSTNELLRAREHVRQVVAGAASGATQRASYSFNFTTQRGG
ncbi:MAG TPA: hypothetical protein PLU79_07175 [Burkholderiaceae bacterium]|nr:hypothetical protein [Burkholderiaceae bacterium]HNB47493.1 hypothetical protein [Burkholderiaceae bacterium]